MPGVAAQRRELLARTLGRALHQVGALDRPQTPGLAANGESHMTIAAKWLGPCAAGQKPGDVMMGNGMKMNVFDIQKMNGAPGRPGGN